MDISMHERKIKDEETKTKMLNVKSADDGRT